MSNTIETTERTKEAATLESDVRLLNMLADLKDALRKTEEPTGVEPALIRELDRIAHRLKDAAGVLVHGAVDEARLHAHLGLLEAKERLTLIEPFVQRALGRAFQLESPSTKLSVARLHVALGRMELADLVRERKQRARDEVKGVERATERALEELSERIAAFTTDLRA